jgi:large subunit ribosomal protein L16
MGAGKGTVEEYVAVVKTNKIIYEVDGLTKLRARKALKIAGHKMPVRTKFLLGKA